MPNIVPRHSDAPISRMGTSTRLPAKVSRQVEQQAHRGLVTAAKVHSAAYVTHVAMQHVAMLSADEASLIEMCPLAEPRLKPLVDQFTAVAAFEIQQMGW
ncbi:MAG: hypothetical protein ACYC33_06985 [Thermoleophilia bacterium]